MKTEDINSRLQELIEKHKDIWDEFTINVPKVELKSHYMSFKEKQEMEENPTKLNTFLSSTEYVQNANGRKAFLKYGEMVVNCVNKIANAEGRKDVIFEEEEVLNLINWKERIKSKKEGDVWISLVDSLMWCVAFTHESRIKEMRDSAEILNENE